MAEQRVQRRLAAILAADVAGYSRLMGADEEGTLTALTAHRSELIEPCITEHRGRLVKTTGDGLLAEFTSVVDAVRFAVVFQEGMRRRNAGAAGDRRIEFRVGVNLGDVIVHDDDVYGDGVNVAARLEALAEPGGICVSEMVRSGVRGKLAIDFDDLGEQALKNIAESVRAFAVRPSGATDAAAARRHGAHSPVPEKPSIAVLPFDSIGRDPEQEYFADGLVEDLITTLSKLSGLSVIARNSTFTYKGRAIDVRQVANELGVRYVLEGSVRKGGNRVRINAQLIDATTGAHIWAERYDRPLEDLFEIQDEITLVVAREMQVIFLEGEQARMRYSTVNNVAAWTCWVQGLCHYRGSLGKENWGQARRCWERALALDPASATINALLGHVRNAAARFGWWGDRESELAGAEAHVEKALALDPDNADAYRSLSAVLLQRRRPDEAVAATRRAIELDPGSADVATYASFVFASAGLADEAVEQIERAMRLSPIQPALYQGQLGNAYRLAGRLEDAAAAFKAYNAQDPKFGLVDLVLTYQQMGNSDEATKWAETLIDRRPNFTIAAWTETQLHRDEADVAADVTALRAAGLPE